MKKCRQEKHLVLMDGVCLSGLGMRFLLIWYLIGSRPLINKYGGAVGSVLPVARFFLYRPGI